MRIHQVTELLAKLSTDLLNFQAVVTLLILDGIHLFLNILNKAFDGFLQIQVARAAFALLDDISSYLNDLSKMAEGLLLRCILIRDLSFDILDVFEVIESFDDFSESLYVHNISLNRLIPIQVLLIFNSMIAITVVYLRALSLILIAISTR